MPINKNAFIRYRCIDNLLRTKSFVKTATIIDVLSYSCDLSVSSRTVNKDINDMQTDLGAPIEYSHSEKAYYYPDNVEEIFPKIELQNEEIHALQFYTKTLQQYKDFPIFKDFTAAIDKVVDAVKIHSFQNTTARRILIQPEVLPRFEGIEHITKIIAAFDQEKKLLIKYKKHSSNEVKEHLITPVMLKEYDHLWYLIANIKDRDFITTFALDRIEDLKIMDESSEIIHDFDPDKFYKYFYGISRLKGEVEEVVLEFDKWRGNYLIKAPIHSTQELVEENNDKVVFKFQMILNHELYSKILSYGKTVRVIAPESLKVAFVELLCETLNKYNS